MQTTNLKELIDSLLKLRDQYGDETLVGAGSGRQIAPVYLYVVSVGKSDKSRTVSRGGLPLVLFSDQ